MAEQLRIEPRRTAIVAVDFQHDIVAADGRVRRLVHAEFDNGRSAPAA